jgi:hypothetical protein
MISFSRLLCLATLTTAAAFAQTSTPDFVTSDPSLASETRTSSQTNTAHSEIAAPSSTVSDTRPNLQSRPLTEHALLPTATVLHLKLRVPISTTTAKPGQLFFATLSRAIDVDGRTVVPAGANVNCRIERAHGGRRIAGKPSLSIKALSVHMPSGEELNFTASVVDTDNPHHLDVDDEGRIRGSSPNPIDKIELGALAGSGALAGALIAGPEGLLIGTASGALVAAGHIMVKHHDLTLPAGTELIFELDGPATATNPSLGGMQ